MKRGRAAAQERLNELTYQESVIRWQLKRVYRPYSQEVRNAMHLEAMRALLARMEAETQGREVEA